LELKLKKIAIALLGLSMVGLLIILSQYGEYDNRDLPSKIHITAKPMDGYQVHVKASFYPSRELQVLCIPIMGTTASGIIKETFNSIPNSGIDVETKKKWSGLCAYQFNGLIVTCTKTDTFPEFKNDSVGSAGIGILDKDNPAIDKNGFGYENRSTNPIGNNALSILVINGRNYFFGCDSDCEDARQFGIDKTNQEINISCMEQKR